MMMEAWTLAGALLGWIAIDLLSYSVSHRHTPLQYRLAGLFVGGLIGFSIAV